MSTHSYGHRQRQKHNNMNQLNKQLRAVSVAEEESTKRNQELLRNLTKVSKRAAILSDKTDRLKKVRCDYEVYISRLYPQWRQYMQSLNDEEAKTVPSPEKVRNNKQKSPEKGNHYDDGTGQDLYPDFMQQKMNRWRHDTSLNTSPENNHSQTQNRGYPQSPPSPYPNSDKHFINRDKYTSHFDKRDFVRSRDEPFLPAHELNERMKATYREPDVGKSNPVRTYSGLCLPVAQELSHQSQHGGDQFLNREEYENMKNRGVANDPFLNMSMDSSSDLSNVTILPQMLGMNSNGQLVLVPLAASLNLNSSLNTTFNELNAKRRFSPVGRNSPSQTFSTNENIDLNQIFKANDRNNIPQSTPVPKQSHKAQQPKQKEQQNDVSPQNRGENSYSSPLPQEKHLQKPEESPLLKKQKSPLFSKLKNLAKFSPSIGKHKEESPKLPVREQISQPSLIDEQERMSIDSFEEHHPTYEVEAERRTSSSSASGGGVQTNSFPLYEGEEDDEAEEHRLHSKHLSRAISDIEELSEHSPAAQPKHNSSSRHTPPSKSNHTSSPPSRVPSSVNKSNGEEESMFSDFSDHSDFELPSRKDKVNKQSSVSINKSPSPQASKSKSPPPQSSNTKLQSPQISNANSPPSKSSKLNSSPPQNSPPRHSNNRSPKPSDSTIRSPPPQPPPVQEVPTKEHREEEMFSDFPALLYVMEVLTDKVKDEDSEEVLALNIEININQANTIIGNAELEGNIGQFSASDLCMSYRYHLEQVMKKRKEPFLVQPLDPNYNFEGDLRDCLNPCYLEIWDSLFIFLSEIMDAFEFNPSQVASIYAETLIPNQIEERLKLESSLGKILTSFAEEDSDSGEESENNEGGEQINIAKPKNTSISMTEELITKTPVSKSEPISFDSKHSTEKGDLSRTLSMEHDDNDDDTSSTMSFDSDGLPVKRSKKQISDSPPSAMNNNSYSDDFDSSNKINISGSKAYQDMYRESLVSPVHEDLDDEDGLEDLLGESIGLKNKSGPSKTSSHHSLGAKSTKYDDDDPSTRSQSTKSKKVNLKKPGFWESESESDYDVGTTGRSGDQSKNKNDDDFDFEFFD